MDAATRDFVRRRAGDRCEYCLLRQEHSDLTHHVEHIVAKQHGGSDNPENLALACHRFELHFTLDAETQGYVAAGLDVPDAAPFIIKGLWIVRRGTLRNYWAGRIANPPVRRGGSVGGSFRTRFSDAARPRR
jgi:hypothetical protein